MASALVRITPRFLNFNVRRYTVRPVFVRDIPSEVNKKSMEEFFSRFGKVAGSKTFRYRAKSKVAHIYFSVGKYQYTKKNYNPFEDQNSTPEEIEQCNEIIDVVIDGSNGIKLCGGHISVDRPRVPVDAKHSNNANTEYQIRTEDEFNQFNKGFKDGYNKGFKLSRG